jgi:hypothetical protein
MMQLSLKPVPRMTTVVPPVTGPLFGVTDVITGLANRVEVAKRVRVARNRRTVIASK